MSPNTIQPNSNLESIEITHGYLPWLIVLAAVALIFILIWKVLIPFFHQSLIMLMDRNEKNIKLVITSFEAIIEKLEKKKFLIFILGFLALSILGCQMDEKVTFHFKPPMFVADSSTVYEPIVPVDTAVIPEFKPEIETVKIKKILPATSLSRNCEPRCDKLEYCNTSTGKCEARAIKKSDNGWNAEKEHSEVFLVDSHFGTFDPRDQYLQGNR